MFIDVKSPKKKKNLVQSDHCNTFVDFKNEPMPNEAETVGVGAVH